MKILIIFLAVGVILFCGFKLVEVGISYQERSEIVSKLANDYYRISSACLNHPSADELSQTSFWQEGAKGSLTIKYDLRGADYVYPVPSLFMDELGLLLVKYQLGCKKKDDGKNHLIKK